MSKEKETKSTLDFSVLQGALKAGALMEDVVTVDNIEEPMIEEPEAPKATGETPVKVKTTKEAVKPAKETTKAQTQEQVEDEEDEDDEDEVTSATDPVEPTPAVAPEGAKPTDPKTLLMALAKDSAERGIIEFDQTEFEKAEDPVEYLLAKQEEKVTNGIAEAIEEYKKGLPEEIEALLDLHEKGVPLYKVLEGEREIAKYEAVDKEALKEDEAMQRQVVRDLLLKTGFTEKEATEEIKEYVESGIIGSKAARAVDKLVAIQTKEAQDNIRAEIDARAAQEEYLENQIKLLNRTIKETPEIIPNIKLTDKERKELFEGIVNVDKAGMNKIAKVKKANPLFDLQVSLIATKFNGDFKAFVEAYDKKATTKAASSLRDIVDANTEGFSKSYGHITTEDKIDAPNKDVMKSALKALKRGKHKYE